MTATIIERDDVLDMLVESTRRHSPLAAGLAETFGGSFWGGAGRLLHTPRDERGNALLDDDARVPAEYLAPAYGYWFQCRPRGVWVGQGAMTRSDVGKPDISWREVAGAVLGLGRQARLF